MNKQKLTAPFINSLALDGQEGDCSLWVEENVPARHAKLAEMIKSTITLHPQARLKIIQNSPGEELTLAMKSLGSKIIEAKDLKVNLFDPISFDYDLDFRTNEFRSEYFEFLQSLGYPISRHHSPAGVYTFITKHQAYGALTPEERADVEKIKESITPTYDSLRLFSDVLRFYQPNPTYFYDEALEKFYQENKGNSLADFTWQLLADEDEELYQSILPIQDHPLSEVFFSKETPDFSGNCLFIANHPNSEINELLTGFFFFRTLGELVQSFNSNVLIIDEKYKFKQTALWRGMAELTRIVDMRGIQVLSTSSFIPQHLAYEKQLRTLVTSELLGTWSRNLILGKITKNQDLLCRSPYPQIPLAELKALDLSLLKEEELIQFSFVENKK